MIYTDALPGTRVTHQYDDSPRSGAKTIGTIEKYCGLGFVIVRWETPFKTLQKHHIASLELAEIPKFTQQSPEDK